MHPTKAETQAAHPAPPVGRPHTVWPVAAWLLVAVSAGVLAAGIYGRLLTPGLLLDLMSFWPGLLLALLLALSLRPLRRRGAVRINAILPLLLLTWMWGGVALHLSEWELLPSAAADLSGPPAEGVASAELGVELGGALTVRTGSGSLYRVEPERRGGPAGAPAALERIEDGTASVRIAARPSRPWFSSSGWRLWLAPSARWTLELDAAELDADLSSLLVGGVDLRGAGVVRLPPPDRDVPVTVDGRVVLSLPPSTPVRVDGPARVPEGWEVTAEGRRSPVRGPGYLITVAEGADLTILER